MRPREQPIALSADERQTVQPLVRTGTAPARTITHAHILLKADSAPTRPNWTDVAIAAALDISERTVERVRRRYTQEGLSAALQRRSPRRVYPHALDGEQEAHLVALACSAAPEGHARWTLRLLAARLVQLEVVETISHEAVRQALKKTC
jgi:transposase